MLDGTTRSAGTPERRRRSSTSVPLFVSMVVVLGACGDGGEQVGGSSAVSAATVTVTLQSTAPTPPPTSSGDESGRSLTLLDWVEQQEAEGRMTGYVDHGIATEAVIVVAAPDDPSSPPQRVLALPDGRAYELPDGLGPNRLILTELAGRPVLITSMDTQFEMWLLTPDTGEWTKGPALGVVHDGSSPFVGALDGRLVVASQTLEATSTGTYVPTRFDGVIVDKELATTPMSDPPTGLHLWVTSSVGPFALLLGRDAASGSTPPLTQPWSFDVRTNTWREVPQPEWLDCTPDCEWTYPHEYGDPSLEAVAGDRVVKRLPDGTIGQYRPSDRTWERLADAPFDVRDPAVAVFDDLVVVAPIVVPEAYVGSAGEADLGRVGVLDLSTGSWSTTVVGAMAEALGGDPIADPVAVVVRSTADVALFDIFRTYSNDEPPDRPVVAFDAATGAWREPTPDEVRLWPRLYGTSVGLRSLRDFIS